MSIQVTLGTNEDYGKLVTIRKQKCYAGKSTITGKALKRICYIAYFYNDIHKVVGYLGDNNPFTTELFSKSFSELKQHLKQYGYTNFEVES